MEQQLANHHVGRTRRVLRSRGPAAGRGAGRYRRSAQQVRIQLRTVWAARTGDHRIAPYPPQHCGSPAVRPRLDPRYTRIPLRSAAFDEAGCGGKQPDIAGVIVDPQDGCSGYIAGAGAIRVWATSYLWRSGSSCRPGGAAAAGPTDGSCE